MDETQKRRLMIGTRIALPLVIVLLGVVIFAVLQATAPRVRQADDLQEPTQVRVFRAQQIPVQRQWQGYGTAEARVEADVPARVTATVEQIPEGIEAGRPVERGQLLVQLDPSDFQREVEVAEQNLAQLRAQLAQWEVERERLVERLAVETEDTELARSELERVQEFVSRGGGSQQDIDRARRTLLNAQRTRLQTAELLDLMGPRRQGLEAQIAGQESALRRAQEDLQRTSIISPIDGLLQAVDVELGESVQAGERVARVVNLALIDVPIQLPSAARMTVDVGDDAVVTLPGRESAPCAAVVTRVAPEDDPQTRTMTVYVTVNQEQVPGSAPLTPGTFVASTVDSGDMVARWIVPRRSIRSGRVFTVVDGVVRSVPVSVDYVIEARAPETGLPDDQWAVLDPEGLELEEGRLILVNASQSVLDGERVQPIVAQSAETNVAAGQAAEEAGGAAP